MYWMDGDCFEDRANGVYFGQLAADGRRKDGLGLRIWLKDKPVRDCKIEPGQIVGLYEGEWKTNKR